MGYAASNTAHFNSSPGRFIYPPVALSDPPAVSVLCLIVVFIKRNYSYAFFIPGVNVSDCLSV